MPKLIALKSAWFGRDTVSVAQQLIGKQLTCGKTSVIITETEAYTGKNDPASHAYKGPTKRNQPMYGPPGHCYIYLVYGMHHCLNIVTEAEGTPGAVLLRNAIDIQRSEHINGPGRLTKYLKLNRSMNKKPLDETLIRIYEGNHMPSSSHTRIGISSGKDFLWRFKADI